LFCQTSLRKVFSELIKEENSIQPPFLRFSNFSFSTGLLYQELRPVLDLQPRFSLFQKVDTLTVFPSILFDLASPGSTTQVFFFNKASSGLNNPSILFQQSLFRLKQLKYSFSKKASSGLNNSRDESLQISKDDLGYLSILQEGTF